MISCLTNAQAKTYSQSTVLKQHINNPNARLSDGAVAGLALRCGKTVSEVREAETRKLRASAAVQGTPRWIGKEGVA